MDHANSVTVLPEGVEKIDVSYESGLSGFTRNYFVYLNVTTADGFVVGDEAALLEWLLRLGWSLNDHRLASVNITMASVSGSPFEWDDAEAFARLNLDPERVINRSFPPPPMVFVAQVKLEPLFGDWPGEVPETPSGLFERAP